jgi:gas vesicle protein
MLFPESKSLKEELLTPRCFEAREFQMPNSLFWSSRDQSFQSIFRFDLGKANATVIEQKTKAIDALRGAGAGPENYQRLFDQIKSGADTDIGLLYVKGAQLATQAEDFGKTLISDAEQRALAETQRGAAAGADISTKAQTTASDITRQFEQRLSQFKMSTQSEAQTVLQRSRETAQGIRNAAAGKAKDQRDRMYQEASRIEQNTKNQVQDFLRESDKEVVRLSLLLTKTGRRMEQSKWYSSIEW